MADNGTTALDLYGLPQEVAAERLAQRNAQLQQQSNLGVLGMLSGDQRLGAVGKTLQEQAYQAKGENLGQTAEHVLTQTLHSQQEAESNQLQRQKYQEELAQHADESARRAQETALGWAQLKRGNRALDIEEADKKEARRLEEMKLAATKTKESKEQEDSKKGLAVLDNAIDQVTANPGAYSTKQQTLQSLGNVPVLGGFAKTYSQKTMSSDQKAARSAAEQALLENLHYIAGRIPGGQFQQFMTDLHPLPTDTAEDILAKLRNARSVRLNLSGAGSTPSPVAAGAPASPSSSMPSVFSKYGGSQ